MSVKDVAPVTRFLPNGASITSWVDTSINRPPTLTFKEPEKSINGSQFHEFLAYHPTVDYSEADACYVAKGCGVAAHGDDTARAAYEWYMAMLGIIQVKLDESMSEADRLRTECGDALEKLTAEAQKNGEYGK